MSEFAAKAAPMPSTMPANPSALRRRGLTVAFAVLALDQLIKFIVMVPLSLPTVRSMELVDIFALTFVRNFGTSFGLFRADSDAGRWFLVAFTSAIAAVVAMWMWREKSRIDVTALGLILGGALGNIVDRIRVGFVIDYADLHFGDFRPFLVFNLADAAITIGVLLLVARALLVRDKAAGERKVQQGAAAPSSGGATAPEGK